MRFTVPFRACLLTGSQACPRVRAPPRRDQDLGSRCVTSPCRANAWPRLRFGSRDLGVSDVRPQPDPHRARALYHHHSVLLRRLALLFNVFFFDDWGRDEDPRWFGGEHSPGVGGRHKTTALISSYHRVPAALAATALARSTSQTTTKILPTSCSVHCERN